MTPKDWLVPGLVGLIAIVAGWAAVSKLQDADPFQSRRALLERGMDLPVAWMYIQDGDVNGRAWGDFMGRSSRVLNLPFLNLCYESFVRQNGSQLRVEVIGGLQDLALRMGGWEALPTPLQNPQAIVREPELNWIRAAVLAKWGGLWVAPSTVWMKPIGPLPKETVVFFGTDPVDSFSTPNTGPSLQVLWAPAPALPAFVEWEAKARDRLERRSGGSEFRRDEMSDAMDALTACGNAELRSQVELSRKGASQKRIELEDLLAADSDGYHKMLKGSSKAAYLPIPYPELLQREAFGWFLRMSEDQILESDLVISHFLRRALSS